MAIYRPHGLAGRGENRDPAGPPVGQSIREKVRGFYGDLTRVSNMQEKAKTHK